MVRSGLCETATALIAVVLVAVVLVATPLLPASAWAGTHKAKTALHKADKAWLNGDFAGVVKHADEGLAEADLADLRFVKARALWALGKHETAWKLMKSFSPGTLSRRHQEVFAVEYERMERQMKDDRSVGKRMDAIKHSLAKHRDLENLQDTVSTVFWVGAAAGLLIGGGLLAYGIVSHSDAATRDDREKALYIASAGALIAGGGGGFGIAALVVSPSGPVMNRQAAAHTSINGHAGMAAGPARTALPMLTWATRF